jgi:3-keto-disaccharide hydrolase
MSTRVVLLAAVGGAVVASGVMTAFAARQPEYKSGIVWPEPAIVTPGKTDSEPPSDATVLFDGKDLSKWTNGDRWEIKDGYAIVKGGDITTKDSFGDYQFHIEFATPEKVSGSGQGRGNSGVFLANRYEVQVLDSYNNKTYLDGQCASLYKQSPPMVNVCRKPGEWQSFDIIFTAPRFDESAKDVKVLKPGYVTVIHNGVVVQNHFELQGGTYYDKAPSYQKHPLKQPIRLQNHGNPVKYRNIWLREIKPLEGKKPQ